MELRGKDPDKPLATMRDVASQIEDTYQIPFNHQKVARRYTKEMERINKEGTPDPAEGTQTTDPPADTPDEIVGVGVQQTTYVKREVADKMNEELTATKKELGERREKERQEILESLPEAHKELFKESPLSALMIVKDSLKLATTRADVPIGSPSPPDKTDTGETMGVRGLDGEWKYPKK